VLGAAQDDVVVITATRQPQPSLEVPASVDRIYADEIREGRPQVNLSESLGRVPGIVVQNRQNYAQDLQISSRGFGARSTFGVRGIRLMTDGIPASMPDGQGQAANFDLGSAQRIEVLRGPLAQLYGNAAGGVVQVFSGIDSAQPSAAVSAAAGPYGQTRVGARFSGASGSDSMLLDAARYHTGGYREHSAAQRTQINAKWDHDIGNDARFSLVANALQYSPANGCVRIEFIQMGDRGSVIVTDDGPPIPSDLRLLATSAEWQNEAKQRHEARYGRGLGLYCAAEAARIAGAQIDIEDSGEVRIAAFSGADGDRARDIIRGITEDPEIGRIYSGTVRRVVPFGAFVEISPGKDGLVHISELEPHRVERVEDVINEGDTVLVKVIGIDREGKIKLSRKQALPGYVDTGEPAGAGGGSRGGGGGGDRPRRRPEHSRR